VAHEAPETVMAEEAAADGRTAALRLGEAVDVEVERPLHVEVIAIFGPTASGKSAVAEAVADRLGTEVVSADAMQVYRGLPILTNQPARPTRLVGIRALGEEMSAGAFAALAHAEIDEVVRARGLAVVAGGTGLYLRAALADLEVPPPVDPALRRRIEREVDADRAAAHGRLSAVDPTSAEAVHPNDRKRLVRALELAETGRSLVAGQERLWSGATRHPTLICGLAVSSDVLERRIRVRADAMFENGVVAEVRAALAQPLSRTAEKALGLSEIGQLEPTEALERIVVRTRRYAAYQRKWMRRIPGLVPLNGERPAGEVADEIVALAQR
jgi:tRNA dimethylallyltransferase